LNTETVALPDYSRINWSTAVFLALLHIGAVAALFHFSWPALFAALALHWIALSWGIGMGYHRLHTHRGYKVPRWLDYFLAVCGSLSLEGGPIFWVATHRIHHQKSDQPGDPHSPRDGAWWAHVGWILFGEARHNNTTIMSKYAPDLAKDRFHVWLNNYHYVPLAVVGVAMLVFGGLPMFLWAICLRVALGLHFTWLVNSATHMWGSRRFATRDDSRNNWWVALITFGEGWHNNHHAHPTSARHGLAWYEVDLTWYQIRLLSRLGLLKNVKTASVDSHMASQKAA
jgi:stearoyl-CoA desaturase (delta-9 desaturase)